MKSRKFRKKEARRLRNNSELFYYLWAALIGTILALLLHNTAAGTILTLVALCGSILGIIKTAIRMRNLK